MDTSYADRQDVSIATGSHVEQCVLEHVQIGPHCKLIQCVIRGTADSPVIIDAHCELIQCQIEDTGKRKSFQMNNWKVSGTSVFIGAYTKLHQTRVENASIGAHTTAIRATILHSEIGPHNTLRSHGNFTLVKSAEGCNLGSEISKTILDGQGFVSEHTASYLSLIAPSTYPIVNAQGKEQLLEGLPNLTNIGAGTVFANYSGKPRGANTLAESPGSQKGTALVFGAFTGVNSVIVNRYGQPKDEDMFSLLRRSDLTIIGLCSLIEKKVTGRIPAFSHASQTSAKTIRIGWVLDHQPGIVLNIFKKMQKQLGAQKQRLHDLLEGTIRLERQWLQEQLQNPGIWDKKQLEDGLETYHRHLDGRWHIDEAGELTTPWTFDEHKGKWVNVP